jgi:hypothetical protein
MALGSRKPAAAPLQSGITVRSGGVDVAVSWSAGSVAGEESSLWAALSDGLSLVGQVVTFSGSVSSTNGVASPIGPVDVPVFDFGPARTGTLDFTTANPASLATLGDPARSSSGDMACPGGCLVLNTGQGVGLRFTSPGASLHVEATGVTSRSRRAPWASTPSTPPKTSST